MSANRPLHRICRLLAPGVRHDQANLDAAQAILDEISKMDMSQDLQTPKQALRSAMVGKPAKIPWPHRVLHDALAEIERLERLIVSGDAKELNRERDRIKIDP